MRYYVVSDVHGFCSEMKEALRQKGYFDDPMPHKLIVCGHVHCSYGHAKLEGDGEEMGEYANFEPHYAQGIIAIDACTSYSHKVNCIVIEDEGIESIEKNIQS